MEFQVEFYCGILGEIHDGFPGGKQGGIPIGCSCLNS